MQRRSCHFLAARPIASSGTADDARLLADLYVHNASRQMPQKGSSKPVVDDFTQPNGICFSPDEKKLYIIDTGLTDGGPSHTSRSPSQPR
jgi:hypothetical protein